MEKMLDYIAAQLRDTEVAIKILNKAFRAQAKKNRNIALFNILIAIYIWQNERAWKAQLRINKATVACCEELKEELESLKQTKGE